MALKDSVLRLALVIALIGLPSDWAIGGGGEIGSDQGHGDPRAGAVLAEQNCARCHAIAPGGVSPAERAPRFETLGQRYPLRYLEEAMAEGLMVAHSDPPMPEFIFTPEEIADLLAYLESLAEGS